jgi:hypothetical protein
VTTGPTYLLELDAAPGCSLDSDRAQRLYVLQSVLALVAGRSVLVGANVVELARWVDTGELPP